MQYNLDSDKLSQEEMFKVQEALDIKNRKEEARQMKVQKSRVKMSSPTGSGAMNAKNLAKSLQFSPNPSS